MSSMVFQLGMTLVACMTLENVLTVYDFKQQILYNGKLHALIDQAS